jgi:hypothetical protein
MAIEIINGCLLDAFDRNELDVIAHCANMQNTFGSGIAKSIKERYPEAYEYDTIWYNEYKDWGFGSSYSFAEVHRFCVDPLLDDPQTIFNLYGQEYYGTHKRQLNYGRISEALNDMSKFISGYNDSYRIGFPYKMGSDRAGGSWEIVLEMIEYYFKDLDVKIYKLDGGK